MRFPPEFLDEIRRRVSLVDVIARRVKLTRKGREHTGLCPFHNEKTPSFTVSEEKGFYHCFGCGAHGDIFGFLVDNEGLPFPEAVENLAGLAGVEVPQMSKEEVEAYERRSSLYDVMEAAAKWYESQLASGSGKAGLDYLENRSLTSDTIKTFRLGFAPDGRTLLKDAMLARKFPEEQLIEAGLLIKPEDGKPSYDRFRGRIMFPIADVQGRVIAFGGRAMASDAKAKYLNSPETPLFHKGHNLYNLASARKAAYDAGTIIVAEGYMDVIALAQGGIINAVAPLGTAITEEQIMLLWRMAPEPVLCFDGDNAGVRAAERAMERALPKVKAGHSMLFALMPMGEDPDSLIMTKGRSAFEDIVSSSLSLVEMLWRTLTNAVDISTPERRAGLEKKIFEALRPIEDEKVRQFYNAEFRERLNQMFWNEKTKNRTGGAGSKGKMRAFKGKTGHSGQGFTGASVELKSSRLGQTTGTSHSAVSFEELILLVVLNHPQLLVSHLETLIDVEIETEPLEILRREIVHYAELSEGLDREHLHHHLRDAGLEKTYNALIKGDSFKSVWHAWPSADLADAETGWLHTINRQRYIVALQRDKNALELELGRNATDENFERLKAIKLEIEGAEANLADIEGYGLATKH